MATNNKSTINELEISNARHNLELIRSQLKSGRLDAAYAAQQIDKLDKLLERVAEMQKDSGRSAQFEALYNVSRVLGASLDLQTVLDQVMDAIIQLTGADRGFLMLRDDHGGITVKAARNVDQQTVESTEFRFSRTITNQVMDSGEAVLTTNASQDPRFSSQRSVVSQSLRSIMASPLRARGNVIGAVYVDSGAITGLFNQQDLNALEAFSAQAAIALDNAILFAATDEELAVRLDELRQLRRIDLLLNETLELEKALEFTLEWAVRLSNADGGYIGLMENGNSELETLHQHGPETETFTDALDATFPQVADAMESQQIITFEHDSKQLLAVPIDREQIKMGVILLYRKGDEAFTDAQKESVERVIARAAVTIENARLYAAVQAADRAKSEFVGIVAHDLKAPMTSIRGYSEIMLMQKDVPQQNRDYLDRIRATVDRMNILVSDLADISRIESGHFFMDETNVSVSAVVQAIKDSTLPQFTERNHTFVEEIEPDLPRMRVDYYRLLQVLTNLVSNAYKYTPDGGTITLTVNREDERIRFSVTDTGIGLSEESLKQLGTKFWRAPDDFTRSQPGTGLGFSITMRLIEQMGDQIHIQSKEGEGSTFTFSVPIADDAATDAD